MALILGRNAVVDQTQVVAKLVSKDRGLDLLLGGLIQSPGNLVDRFPEECHRRVVVRDPHHVLVVILAVENEEVRVDRVALRASVMVAVLVLQGLDLISGVGPLVLGGNLSGTGDLDVGVVQVRIQDRPETVERLRGGFVALHVVDLETQNSKPPVL